MCPILNQIQSPSLLVWKLTLILRKMNVLYNVNVCVVLVAGNPAVEVTKGIIHLYRDTASHDIASLRHLPVYFIIHSSLYKIYSFFCFVGLIHFYCVIETYNSNFHLLWSVCVFDFSFFNFHSSMMWVNNWCEMYHRNNEVCWSVFWQFQRGSQLQIFVSFVVPIWKQLNTCEF
jgi:hypothetical protein